MPDGTQVLELSMKVKEADAEGGLDTLVELLADRDLGLASAQESKTLRALEALAGSIY